MSTRPTGTVTFLFAEIAGSTERTERDRAAMEAALERHDGIWRKKCFGTDSERDSRFVERNLSVVTSLQL